MRFPNEFSCEKGEEVLLMGKMSRRGESSWLCISLSLPSWPATVY